MPKNKGSLDVATPGLSDFCSPKSVIYLIFHDAGKGGKNRRRGKPLSPKISTYYLNEIGSDSNCCTPGQERTKERRSAS